MLIVGLRISSSGGALDRDDYNVDLQYRYQEENTDPQVEKLLKLMTQLTESQINLIYDHFGAGKQLKEICNEENAANGTNKKLLFFPILLLTVIEFLIRHPNPCALFGARLAGITAGMTMIVVLYYLYTFVLGRNFLAADILLFLTSVCFSYVISGHLFRKFRQADPMLVFLGWLLAVLLFFSFTCFPPDIFLFYPP